MARPTKPGLQYFTIDCDIFQDEKMVAVCANLGAKGAAVLLALLCAIYRNGYYALWNESLRLKIVKDLVGAVTPELVDKVIEFCLKCEFFAKDLRDGETKILTSPAIQRRYLQAKRGKLPERLPFWVIAAKTPVSAAKTPIIAAKTPINNKVNTSTIVDVGKPSPPSPPPKEKEEILSSEKGGSAAPYSKTFDEEVEEMLADTIWLEAVAKNHGLRPGEIEVYLRSFPLDCAANGKAPHTSYQDARQHFNYWLGKRLKAIRNDTQQQPLRAGQPPAQRPQAPAPGLGPRGGNGGYGAGTRRGGPPLAGYGLVKD